MRHKKNRLKLEKVEVQLYHQSKRASKAPRCCTRDKLTRRMSVPILLGVKHRFTCLRDRQDSPQSQFMDQVETKQGTPDRQRCGDVCTASSGLFFLADRK